MLGQEPVGCPGLNRLLSAALGGLAAVVLVVASSAAGCAAGSGPGLPDAPEGAAALPEQAALAVRTQYEALAAKPDDAEAAGRLGMLLQGYELWESAVRFYTHAEQRAPRTLAWPYLNAYVLAQRGDVEAAERSYRRALSLEPAYVPARIRLAELLLADERWDEAEELYGSVLELTDVSAAAEFGLGRIAAALGDDKAAIVRFRNSLEADPGLSPARYALIQALARTGDKEGAAREQEEFEAGTIVAETLFDPLLEQVEAALPAGPTERLARGKRYEDAGRIKQAIVEYERAVEMDPEYADAHVNLISAYGKIGRYEEAEKHFAAAQALGSEAPELFYNLGVMRTLQGRYAEAVPAFEQTLERNPAFADAHANLGYALEELGRPADAMRRYRGALEHQPNHRQARFHYGRRLLAAGRASEAIPHLSRAAAGPPDAGSPHILYALAHAQAAAGRTPEARESLRTALRLARKHQQNDIIEALETALTAVEK